MAGDWGSVPPYATGTFDDIRETIGIPQFSGAASTDWQVVFNGLLIQGGIISIPSGTTVFPFTAVFSQQVLGVFLQPFQKHAPGVTATTLDTFTVDHTGSTHDAYWWAIGI